MTTKLYYNDTLLSEEDYPIICNDFKIPYSDLLSVIEQIKAKGEPLYSKFQSTVRERIREWFAGVSLDGPQQAQKDAGDCLVVDGAKQDAQSPPAAKGKVKKGGLQILPESKEDDVHVDDAVGNPIEFADQLKAAGMTNRPVLTDPHGMLVDPPEDIESTEPAPLAETDEITDSAAVMLMKAMTSGEGHFIITDEGICTINQDSPPTLVHSYQVIQNVIRLGGLGDKVKDKQSWMLGSITAALEDYHGEAFNIGQVCEQTEKAENTIRQAVSVFRKFKNKKYNLSYSHHQEAYHIKVPWETTCLILHKAECYELSAKNVRLLGSIVKTMDDDQVVRNIRSTEQAHDLIDAYKQAKVKYLCYDEGAWMEITGLAGELPKRSGPDEPDDHFPVVLDLKNKLAYANGEKQGEILKRGLRKV